jgi:type I pantothenate kinase
VDADTANISSWFINRFRKLRESAFTNPLSYFHRYAEIPLEAAEERAHEIWNTINLPNLEANILPTRSRANLVLRKGRDHKVESVLLRKI